MILILHKAKKVKVDVFLSVLPKYIPQDCTFPCDGEYKALYLNCSGAELLNKNIWSLSRKRSNAYEITIGGSHARAALIGNHK